MKILSEQEAVKVLRLQSVTGDVAPALALYANGYILGKLEEGETAPTSIDLAQAQRLLEGVSGLAEITDGHWHAELENMLTGVTVEVGQVWTGLTGNRMVVREVKDGRARLSYEDDPGDEAWEDCADVVLGFTLIGVPGLATRADVARWFESHGTGAVDDLLWNNSAGDGEDL